jgi:hypothetical protein
MAAPRAFSGGSPSIPIERVDVRVCRFATDGGPHSDGTASWDAITMVIVEPRAAGVAGLGCSYIEWWRGRTPRRLSRVDPRSVRFRACRGATS